MDDSHLFIEFALNMITKNFPSFFKKIWNFLFVNFDIHSNFAVFAFFHFQVFYCFPTDCRRRTLLHIFNDQALHLSQIPFNLINQKYEK